jgi:hypothetical protein
MTLKNHICDVLAWDPGRGIGSSERHFSWFSSYRPCKYQESTSIRPRTLPSKYILINHPPIILPLDAVKSEKIFLNSRMQPTEIHRQVQNPVHLTRISFLVDPVGLHPRQFELKKIGASLWDKTLSYWTGNGNPGRAHPVTYWVLTTLEISHISPNRTDMQCPRNGLKTGRSDSYIDMKCSKRSQFSDAELSPPQVHKCRLCGAVPD